MASGDAVRVLVVEDDAFTLMTLATVVASLGYEVVDQAATVARMIVGVAVDKQSVCTSIGSNTLAVASLNPSR